MREALVRRALRASLLHQLISVRHRRRLPGPFAGGGADSIDVVLNGHEHVYERFAPQTPTGAADALRGIWQFTVGTGGRSHYALGRLLANSEVQNADTFGVLKVTLGASGYSWKFVPEAGRVFTDTGSAPCR